MVRNLILALLAYAAAVSIMMTIIISVARWLWDKPEIWATKYGRGPVSRWMIECGSFAVFLFLELVFIGFFMIGGVVMINVYFHFS